MNIIINIIAIGIASSYCNQTNPPPEANAINAGAPNTICRTLCGNY